MSFVGDVDVVVVVNVFVINGIHLCVHILILLLSLSLFLLIFRYSRCHWSSSTSFIHFDCNLFNSNSLGWLIVSWYRLLPHINFNVRQMSNLMFLSLLLLWYAHRRTSARRSRHFIENSRFFSFSGFSFSTIHFVSVDARLMDWKYPNSKSQLKLININRICTKTYLLHY